MQAAQVAQVREVRRATPAQMNELAEAIERLHTRLIEDTELASEAFRLFAVVHGPGEPGWDALANLYQRLQSAARQAGAISRQLDG